MVGGCVCACIHAWAWVWACVMHAWQRFLLKSYQCDMVECGVCVGGWAVCGWACVRTCLRACVRVRVRACMRGWWGWLGCVCVGCVCVWPPCLQVLKQNEQMLSVLAVVLTLCPQVPRPLYPPPPPQSFTPARMPLPSTLTRWSTLSSGSASPTK